MDNHIEDQAMKNSMLFKIVKMVFRVSIKLLRFSLKIILGVFSSSYDKEVEEARQWQDDYDEYAKSVTRRKSH